MKIILFTQEDPFYLPETTQDFIHKISKTEDLKIIQAIITPPSVFGKKETFIQKTIKTYRLFGLHFFMYYSFNYLFRKFVLRKSVKKVIENNNIPVLSIENSINSKENLELIKSLNADLILIIAGNQIIRKSVLESTKYGVFNVHSSLLPDYKGLMPSFWVLKNNEKITGVTLYKLTEGIDDGPIISQKAIEIPENMTQAELIILLKIKANDLLIETLSLIKDFKNYKFIEGGSYYKFPAKQDILEFKKNNKKFF